MTVTPPDNGRTGRRPGQSTTKDAILAAARERFAEVGFDKASIRSIATAAGVDSALVHHYFGTKQALFVEVVQLPVDPAIIVDAIAAAPLDGMGEQIVRSVVTVWDSPAGAGVIAAFRGVLAGGDTGLLRSFLLDVALKGVRDRVDSPAGTGRERIALVASQMIGLFAARKILEIDPIATMPVERLAELIGPNLQRYLTGDLTQA